MTEDHKQAIADVIVWGVAILFVVFIAIKIYASFFGEPIIGSWIEKSLPYETRYQVNLFPKADSTKNYLLPANVSVEQNGIYVTKVTFPNGGFLRFDDCYLTPLNPNDNCVDQDGESWKVDLTTTHLR